MAKGWPEHLFLVGCGNMAGQMLNRWLDCGLDPSRVTVLRPSGGSVADGVDVVTTYPQALAHGTTVMLGMKPYQVADVAAQLAPLCHSEVSMLSILAGTTLGDLRARFPATGDIVRAMPNLPVGMGQGVVALYTDAHTSPSGRANMEALLGPLGLSEWMADEALFNRVTALSRAGEAIGIPADQAARMAMATVQGAANMAAAAQVTPATLADQVASPGGMTREGLNILDADDRLLTLMTETLEAARDRGEAMARGD